VKDYGNQEKATPKEGEQKQTLPPLVKGTGRGLGLRSLQIPVRRLNPARRNLGEEKTGSAFNPKPEENTRPHFSAVPGHANPRQAERQRLAREQNRDLVLLPALAARKARGAL